MTPPVTTPEDARFIYDEWDRRARTGDTPALLELYADDAVLETPLAPRILDQPSGTLRGKVALREFFDEGLRRRPNDKVRWHRDGTFLFDGRLLFWEYCRETPDGEQVDIAEIMEIVGRTIVTHRIYWGWFGTEMLIASAVSDQTQ